MMPSSWDFPYCPIPTSADDDGEGGDVIVATARPIEKRTVYGIVHPLFPDAQVETVFERAPLFWTRIRSCHSIHRAELARLFSQFGIPVRYVASSLCGSMALPPPLPLEGAPHARPSDWRCACYPHKPAISSSDGCWFLRDRAGGVAVDRQICGWGAARRLAVIDDDAAEADKLDLDAEILIHLDTPPRAQSHGALMAAWATRTRTGFEGVAPAASTRLYCIPKPDHDVLSLPLAIARAVHDGADVIVCATYVEGAYSPMLDDAMEFAYRLGRRGRGTALVFPTGREARSPGDSIHTSFSLNLADPASDPRVFCVAPGSREGGWFLWRDRRGKLRPFGNRGPAVRWLSPGDDIAYPFLDKERLFHAESSGAAAIAAGVLLLVLAANPALALHELDAVVTRTLTEASPSHPPHLQPLADPYDVLPEQRDKDLHNAKHGYGQLHAARACASASDPVVAVLFNIGEDQAAWDYWDTRHKKHHPFYSAYSRRLARWLAPRVFTNALSHNAIKVLLRHARLIAIDHARHETHTEKAFDHHLAILLRSLAYEVESHQGSAAIRKELTHLSEKALSATRPKSSRKPIMTTDFFPTLLRTLWPPPHHELASQGRTAASLRRVCHNRSSHMGSSTPLPKGGRGGRERADGASSQFLPCECASGA